MYIREQYQKELVDNICEGKTTKINIYGEKGVGKSYIIQHLKQNVALQNEYICGYFDFNQYANLTQSTMIDILYDMCDFLSLKAAIKLIHFNIADRIDSARNNRISYTDRKVEKGGETLLGLTEFMSDFIELPYVGAGVKAAKLTAKMIKKHRPKSAEEKELYRKLLNFNDEEIRTYLSIALAEDVNACLSDDKKIVIILENCDKICLGEKNSQWLYDITDNTKNIVWIFVSRKKISQGNTEVLPIEIKTMGYGEMKEYLYMEKNIVDEQECQYVWKLSNGNLFYAERILEFMYQQKEMGEIDWEFLKEKGYHYIVTETINHLSNDQKEMLFQLSFATYFDKQMFQNLFPGRLFLLYKDWFSTSLFQRMDDGKYCVQNSMKDEILYYMQKVDENLIEDCYEILFHREKNWFETKSKEAPINEISIHLQNIINYGHNISEKKEYFACLKENKDVISNAGYVKILYEEMTYLMNYVDEETRSCVLKEKAFLELYCARYEEAKESIKDGIVFSRKRGQIKDELIFLNLSMQLEYIAPSEEENSVEQCILLAEEYINILNNNREEISYQSYLKDMCKMKLYLSKEHIVKKEYEKGKECLAYIFEICSDERKVMSLSLYEIYAKAQEELGEIYASEKNYKKAMELYKKAVETYQIGELYEKHWDSHFHLNFGLAYKRLGEVNFSIYKRCKDEENEYAKKALFYMDKALAKYEEVRERAPEVMDTYCKIGFTYTAIATTLWDRDEYSAEFESCINKIEDTVKCALEQSEKNGNSMEHGNREICNIRCTGSRLKGLYLARKGNLEEAEQALLKGIKDGEIAVYVAKKHPYGYMLLAKAYLAYGNFLQEQCRKKEALSQAEKGLRMIDIANQCIGNAKGFESIQGLLNDLITKLT